MKVVIEAQNVDEMNLGGRTTQKMMTYQSQYDKTPHNNQSTALSVHSVRKEVNMTSCRSISTLVF